MPTYAERGSLAGVVERVRAAVPEAHLLIVDDNSPDGTGELADQLAAADSAVRVLHRAGKLGLGTAYLTGFRTAIDEGYEVVVEMDADGSHLPEQLPALLSEVAAGADFALGSRWVSGGSIVNWPWYRQLVSKTGTLVARLSLRSQLHDITSGYRAIRTAALSQLDLDRIDAHGYGFQVELAWALERAGFTIVEVPISFVERAEGRSKMTVGIAAEALGIVLRQGFLLRFQPRRLPGTVRLAPGSGDESAAA